MSQGKNKKNTDFKLDNKIGIVFRKSFLNEVFDILTMKSDIYRTFKALKNINTLFTSLDLDKYKGNSELEALIWLICYFSKELLSGVTNPEIIAEMVKHKPEYDSLKEDIISMSLNKEDNISAVEVKKIYDIISDNLQDGYVINTKEEIINLLDDIDLDEPGSNVKLRNRLFDIAQSLVDIKYNTSVIDNTMSFNSGDIDSVKKSVGQTIDSLKESTGILKTGIKRLNTLLSPGYKNGRIYIYLASPAGGKSVMLLKSALDIRQFNPGFKNKNPSMTPCVLYITMENTFNETIERLWGMIYDDPITMFSQEQATEMMCNALGINVNKKDDGIIINKKDDDLLSQLSSDDNKKLEPNIEIIIRYYTYRSISTEDLYTIIQDLADENYEVIALIVDYVKRIRPSVTNLDSVKRELDRIVNELKALAVIKNIPVITAQQLNRTAISAIDNANRSGGADLIKNAGREHVGDAIELLEVGDWVALCNIEYKPGTNEKYMCILTVKRRSVEQGESEDLKKLTYIAHPFSQINGLRILNDMDTDKVLSLKSLATDIDIGPTDKTNAVPRKKLDAKPFEEDDL